MFLTSSRQLLAQAATPQDIAEFDLAELAELLRKSSCGRFGQTKAEALQNLARDSVGVSFLADAARVELHCLLAQMDLLEVQRDRVDEALEQLMASLPQYITTIPGIGPVSGAAILAKIAKCQEAYDALH